MKLKKFKITVKMKKPWVFVAKWAKKQPNIDDALETFAGVILDKEIDDYFEITIEEADKGK